MKRGKFNEKRVELCSVNPAGSLLHNGKSFDFIFDSGAECSLLKLSIADQFSGPVFETPVIPNKKKKKKKNGAPNPNK